MKRLPALVILLSCCTRSKTDPNEAMLMPKPPPPEEARIPADLSIPVEVDGKPARTIDAALLGSKKPDFADQEHRAWSIAHLIGESADRSDSVFTVIGDSNFRVTMPHPKKATDLVPVLMLSRRGEITALLVKPDDPFPAYHGQGRRLERGGDPLPRASKSIARIAVSYDAGAVASAQEPAATATALEITVDGKAQPPWPAEKIRGAGAKKYPSGDAARDSWSLRDLVHGLVGQNARVVAIDGAGHRRLSIDPKAWADTQQVPTLRINRQGLFKFQWLGDRHKLPAEAELRNVHMLEIASGASESPGKE